MQLSEMDDFLSDTNIKELFNDDLLLLLKTIATCVNSAIVVGSNYTKTPFVFWNAKATEILGRGPTEKPPEEWIEVYGIKDAETGLPLSPSEIPLNKAMNGLTAINQVIMIHNHILCKDLYITCNAMPIKNNVIGGVVVFQNTANWQNEISKIENLNAKMKCRLNH